MSNFYPLMRCQACLSVLIEDRPSDGQLTALYDELVAAGAYEEHRVEFDQLRNGRVPYSYYRKKLLARAGRSSAGKRLVEIGGGTGAFARTAQNAGYDYIDYDISEVAVRCQQELGHNAVLMSPAGPPPLDAGCADLVVMWEVIEHLWDVHTYLETIRAALEPGGAMVFSTPNFDRRRYRHALTSWGGPKSLPPVHVNFFTIESLRNVLLGHGWSRVEFTTNRVTRPGPQPAAIWRAVSTAVGLDAPATIFGIAR